MVIYNLWVKGRLVITCGYKTVSYNLWLPKTIQRADSYQSGLYVVAGRNTDHLTQADALSSELRFLWVSEWTFETVNHHDLNPNMNIEW